MTKQKLFMAYDKLNAVDQAKARLRFSPAGRRAPWTDIRHWAFAVNKDGRLVSSRYIEPAYSRDGRRFEKLFVGPAEEFSWL